MIKTKDFVSAILGLVFLGWILFNFLAIKYIVFLGLGFLGLVLLNILVVQDREAWIKGFLDSTFTLLVVLGFVAYGGIAYCLISGLAIICLVDLSRNGFNWGTFLLLLFSSASLCCSFWYLSSYFYSILFPKGEKRYDREITTGLD